jgi:hypothetical protein
MDANVRVRNRYATDWLYGDNDISKQVMSRKIDPPFIYLDSLL